MMRCHVVRRVASGHVLLHDGLLHPQRAERILPCARPLATKVDKDQSPKKVDGGAVYTGRPGSGGRRLVTFGTCVNSWGPEQACTL